MHRPRNPANRRWWFAVFVVAVAAVIVVRIFRPVHPDEPKETSDGADSSLISTQVLSFHLDSKAELDSVADESGSMFLNNRPERPGAPIVQSDPSPAQLEVYKKDGNLAPAAGREAEAKPGVKIEVE